MTEHMVAQYEATNYVVSGFTNWSIFGPESQPRRWHHPHSRWAVSPHFILSVNALKDVAELTW